MQIMGLISAVSSAVAAIFLACIAYSQHRQKKLELRRDVLRRLVAYCYRLTAGFQGRDGEPFIALNEVKIVYAKFPSVIERLEGLHDKLKKKSSPIPDLMALIKAMALAAKYPVKDINSKLFERPFTPSGKSQGGADRNCSC